MGNFEVPRELKEKFHKSAMNCAEWMVGNQIQDWDNANNGRFILYYVVKEKRAAWSDDWYTGVAVMGMLQAYRRTGDKKYLEAAEMGGGYIKSLQILDARSPKYFGALREVTPQTTWCYPRDALTAVWSLLWLFEETGDEEYLYRVKIFIDWFMREAMENGWPHWEFNYRGEPHQFSNLDGNFHGGDGAFFFDYYRVTGDDTFLEKGLKFICDNVVDHFLGEDGRYKIVYENQKKDHSLDGVDKPGHPFGWQRMHRYNDDFTTISLLGGYLYYKDNAYLERVKAHADWLISEQGEPGGYGDPCVPPASATGANLMLDLYEITNDKKYLDSAIKAGEHLLTLQENESGDKMARYGFYGHNHADDYSVNREWINQRTAGYALLALLRLEGEVAGPYYSVLNRSGKIFEPGVDKSIR